jgi:hypothetical protein
MEASEGGGMVLVTPPAGGDGGGQLSFAGTPMRAEITTNNFHLLLDLDRMYGKFWKQAIPVRSIR